MQAAPQELRAKPAPQMANGAAATLSPAQIGQTVADNGGRSSMLTVKDLQFHQAEPDPATLVRMAIDPVVAIATLMGSAFAFGATFDGAYVILSMLVFSLTFPGTRSLQVEGVLDLLSYILKNWILIVGLLWMLGLSSQTLQVFDQRVLMTWAVITPLTLFLAHRLVPVVLERVLTADVVQRKAVIVGANEIGQRLAERIHQNPFLGIRFAGYFDDRGIERLHGIREEELLGSFDDLSAYARDNNIDIVYGAIPPNSKPRIRDMINSLHDTTASVYFVPDILPFELVQARVDTVSGIPVLAVCESPYYGFNRLVKRMSDLVIASLILILIAPLMLFLAVGVKMSSPGPALFKQRRYGLDGREILVYKFRTMTVMEDGDQIRQATENDSRITRYGAFLRKYSLDELPQFVNVLQGRMSVVGPRPHAVAHNEMYRKLIRGYMIRHKVMPGITGLAQVRGLRGETDTLEKMQARIECDLEYLRNWSLVFDLQIILRTIGVVLGRKNAC
jgi:putative colanic acid biosynthesis UDP-glucose lipid carrier transferase